MDNVTKVVELPNNLPVREINILIQYLLKQPQNYKDVFRAAWIIVGYKLNLNYGRNILCVEDSKIPDDLPRQLETNHQNLPYWLVPVAIKILERVVITS